MDNKLNGIENENENEVLNETSEKKVIKVMKASSKPLSEELTKTKNNVDPSNFLKELDIICDFCKKEITIEKYKTICPKCGGRLDAHELVSLFKEEEEAILAKLRQQKKTGQVMQNGTKVEKKVNGSHQNAKVIKKSTVSKANTINKPKNGSLVIKSDDALRGDKIYVTQNKKKSGINTKNIFIAIAGIVLVLIILAFVSMFILPYMEMRGAMESMMNNPNIQNQLYK